MKHDYPGGIVFYKSQDLESISKFYCDRLGFKIWLDQGQCKILRCNNMLLGFIQSEQTEGDGIITLFYPTREDVDRIYLELKDTPCDREPRSNEAYRIYQFFSRDPEGRRLEFQAFLHEIPQ